MNAGYLGYPAFILYDQPIEETLHYDAIKPKQRIAD